MRIVIYTDGSAKRNPGPGGYGIVLMSEDGHRKEVASKIFTGVPEADAISDPKPVVTDPDPKTDKVMDTDGHEIEFTPNAPEQDAS